MNRRRFDHIVLLLMVIGLFMRLCAMTANAQDQPVTTQFSLGCIEGDYINIGYWSDGVEVMMVQTESDTTMPPTFTTEAGWFEDVWQIETGAHVVIQGEAIVHELDMPMFGVLCEGVGLEPTPEPVVIPTLPPEVEVSATPEPVSANNAHTDDCPAWSVESATGDMICLYGLPRIGEYQ